MQLIQLGRKKEPYLKKMKWFDVKLKAKKRVIAHRSDMSATRQEDQRDL